MEETDSEEESFPAKSTIVVSRPVTARSVANALECEPYRILKYLMAADIFVSPEIHLDDAAVKQLAKELGIRIRIVDSDKDDDDGYPDPGDGDDWGGGGNVPDDFSLGPKVPPTLSEHEPLPKSRSSRDRIISTVEDSIEGGE